MCNPMAIGMAVSAAASYKQSRDQEKNQRRIQDAQNRVFSEGLVQQQQHADDNRELFNPVIQQQGKEGFSDKLQETVSDRTKAFDNFRIEAPSDYSFSSTPKNVILSQNKAFDDANAVTKRNTENLAQLSGYNDALFNQGLERNKYSRAFGNLSSMAQGDANLIGLNMNSAANAAYKPINPLYPILGSAGKLYGYYGASQPKQPKQ